MCPQLQLTQLLQTESAELILLAEYGSNKNDWDLLAVYEKPPPRNEIIVGRLDLLALGYDALSQMICHLDPSVTEPLLTGRLVTGNESVWQAMRDSLHMTAVDWPAIRYLVRCGQAAYGNTLACLPSVSSDSSVFSGRTFWSNLSWALSFYEFARYYAQRQGEKNAAIPLASLVEQMRQPVRDLWLDILDAKSVGMREPESMLRRLERIVFLELI